MSQVSKKPISLPPRKRLKPTVNLNVASRRRKDAPSTDVTIDVLAEQPENKNNSKQEFTEQNRVSPHSINGRNEGRNTSHPGLKESGTVLNTTFESEKSFSSLQTVLLQEHNLQEKIDTGHSKASILREGSNNSETSSVSTVLFQNTEHLSASKRIQNDFLEQSIDSLDKTDIITPNATVSNSSIVPQVHESINEKKHNDMRSRRAGKKAGLDLSQRSTLSEPTRIDNKKPADTLSLYSENESKKSENSDVSSISPQVENNTDVESLNDDSVSFVSESSSLRQDLDSSLPKYRKRKVSSMAKRLSEARRDFETRFCDKKPERSALRMFDLIYYNPSSNPMKSSPDKPKEVVVNSKEALVGEEASGRADEEEVDNPAEEENSEGENDNGIPAPRVKVGPNGEIVLDEQSLVIETTQSKKSRQEIANLTVVVDTGSNTTYHTYSKKKRTRSEWSMKETILFYKALQSLGTDFSLMQTLFPTRSRLDLKSKYKKEERINGHLIEKALRYPALFDISELEKEQIIEVSEKSKEEKKKVREKRPKKRSLKALGFDEEDCGPTLKKKNKKKRKRRVSKSHPRNCDEDNGKENVQTQHDESSSDEECNPPEEHEDPREATEHQNVRARRSNCKTLNYAAVENKHAFLEAGVDHLLQSSSENENENNSEIEGEVHEESTPLFGGDCNMDTVQPGSLLIVTTECPDNPGYQICNVFMVQERSNTSCDIVNSPDSADALTPPSNVPNTSTMNTECDVLPS